MIKTGNKKLDELFNNFNDDLILVYGPAATGKSTLCLMSAVEFAKENKKVIYIDSEKSFSVDRVKQMCSDENILNNIFVIKTKNFIDQYSKIKNLVDNKTFSLVIVDTIGFHYRRELQRDVNGLNNLMDLMLKHLAKINKKVPVLLTNQVYSDLNGNTKAIGWNIVCKECKNLIELKKEPRRMKINDKSYGFNIDDKGIDLV